MVLNMPTSCSANGCTNVRTKDCGVTFHRFPLNKERRALWIQRVKRVNFTPSLYTFLCSDHFEPSCFDRTGQTVRLREDAVPTVFNFPGQRHKEMLSSPENVNNKKVANLNPAPVEEFVCPVDVYEDHNYCLLSMSVAKEKICELQRQLELARKRLKISQQRERRIGLQWSEMRDLVSCLRRKKYLASGSVSDAVESTLSSIDLATLRKELKIQSRSAAHHRFYSFTARHFCLTLSFHAPEAYRFVAKHLDLPRPAVLMEWANMVESQPFPREVFSWLCGYSLRGAGQFHLRVNGGDIGDGLDWDSLDEDDEVVLEEPVGNDPAKENSSQALAFLLVAVNGNLKLPIGYALCSDLSSDDLRDLILECLMKLYDFGISVNEVMFDELSTNVIHSKMTKEELYTMLFDFFISQKRKCPVE